MREDWGALWVSRYHMHFMLPSALLGHEEIELLDQAVCRVSSSWQPTRPLASEPVLSREWRTTTGELVRLTALGCYPLLATLGAPCVQGLFACKAIANVARAVPAAGGRLISDAELPWWITAVGARWARVVQVARELQQARRLFDFRYCACQDWTAYDAPHCRGCGHRFPPAQDLERDETRRHAASVVDQCEATLRALGRGEELVPDWPAPAGEQSRSGSSSLHRVAV